MIKETFKEFFYPIIWLIGKITSPCSFFFNEEEETYWTVAEPEKFFEYKWDALDMHIYQLIRQNWYGRWVRCEYWWVAKTIDERKKAKEIFKIIK